jgi:predicted metal-dependent hydrolase
LLSGNETAVNEFICSDDTALPVNVRFSARAKRWRLQLGFQGVLEVVIPEREWQRGGFGKASDRGGRTRAGLAGAGLAGAGLAQAGDIWLEDARVEDARMENAVRTFLEQHRRWIERAMRRTEPQREAYEESRAAGLPTHLDFPLCDEIWLVEYRPTQARSITVRADGLRRLQGTRRVFALKLSGMTFDEELCRRALARFTTRRAKEVIPPFAWEICREIGATPKSITVNKRKSAWGVCTQTGDIRIDRRVLFFPIDLARQVVLHEAAHLRHLNHSERFYDELFSYEGSTKEAEHAVKKGIQFVPAWFLDA